MNWTPEHDDLIRRLYPGTLASTLGEMLGRTTKAIRQRAKALGVRRQYGAGRPPTRWRPIGAERFDKDKQTLLRKVTDTGNSRKDWRRVDLIEWEAIHGPLPRGKVLALKAPGLPRLPCNLIAVTRQERANLQLRDGQPPPPIGSERLSKDGLLLRKVADTGHRPTDWKRIDVIEWEAVNGPIPPGFVLMLKDFSLPRTLDNLALYTRAEHLSRVSVHAMPEELQPLVQLKAQITKAIKRLEKAEAQV